MQPRFLLFAWSLMLLSPLAGCPASSSDDVTQIAGAGATEDGNSGNPDSKGAVDTAVPSVVSDTTSPVMGVDVTSFGARGDGTTNDTAAFNAAVDYVYARGGGTVEIPAGTFVVQGVNNYPGIYFHGQGSLTSADGSIGGVTVLRCPDSPARATPLIRLPTGAMVNLWSGGGIFDLVIDGRQFDSLAAPPAPSGNLVTGLDFRTWQKQKCQFSPENDRVKLHKHRLEVNDAIQFENAGGELPRVAGGALFDNYTYYVNTVVDVDNFTISAVPSGGEELRIDLTSAGTGTSYVGRGGNNAIGAGIGNYLVRNVTFVLCDIGLRGSCSIDQGLHMENYLFLYNWIGYLGEEDPVVGRGRFMLNHVGATGRFLDTTFVGAIFAGNGYGLCPMGAAGPYGDTFGQIATARRTYINNVGLDGCMFFGDAKVGATISGACRVVGSSFQGNQADTTSEGLRVQGGQNVITGNLFGEGSATSALGRAGLVLDGGNGNNDISGTLISDNVFTCLSKPAIVFADTANAAYGSGAITGYCQGVTITSNMHYTTGGKFFDGPDFTGAALQCTLTENTIRESSGTPSMASGAGYIQAEFWRSNVSRNTWAAGLAPLAPLNTSFFIVKSTNSIFGGADPAITVIDNVALPTYDGGVLVDAVSIAATGPRSRIFGNTPGAGGMPCPGDVDGSGAVDLGDLTILLAHFGVASGATLADGNLDGDGDVDLSDLTILLAHFGTTCP